MRRRTFLVPIVALPIAGCGDLSDDTEDRDPYTVPDDVHESPRALDVADDVDGEPCPDIDVEPPHDLSMATAGADAIATELPIARSRWADEDFEGDPVVRAHRTGKLADAVRVDLGVWSTADVSFALELYAYAGEPVDGRPTIDDDDPVFDDERLRAAIDETFDAAATDEPDETVRVDEGAQGVLVDLYHYLSVTYPEAELSFGIGRGDETVLAQLLIEGRHEMVPHRYEYAVHYAITEDRRYRSTDPGSLDGDEIVEIVADDWVELEC